MKVLVIGSGGREHAIVKALKLKKQNIWVLPGNDGMKTEAQLLRDFSWKDFATVSKWTQENQIDLVIIGPEDPLVLGLADFLRGHGVNVFGPSQKAAQLEGSKKFAKEFMNRHRIPTSNWVAVTRFEEVEAALKSFSPPYVMKADGLAAGKGVVICKNEAEALHCARSFLVEKKLGHAGSTLLIEEFIAGREISLFFFTNGREWTLLPSARDHKRLQDGDQGPNTGGMGTVAPMHLPEKLLNELVNQVVTRTVSGLQSDALEYRGVVFVGLMIHPERGAFVLEYNCRFGDPETQVLLPLFASSFAEACHSVAKGKMPVLEFQPIHTCCVVVATPGYPEAAQTGVAIANFPVEQNENSYVIVAGASELSSGAWETSGGRVFGVVGVGETSTVAREKAYSLTEKIRFPGCQFRKDIGL